MALEGDHSKNERFHVVRGLPFPLPYPGSDAFSRKYIEEAMDYLPRDNDLIIASYPKTGTTWIQYIHLQIISKATAFHSFNDMTFKIYPYMELAGTAAIEAQTENRAYKHHIPYNLVKNNPKAKIIYIYRHPEDTVVSYYHFYRGLMITIQTFEEFIDSFVTGDIQYGSYFKHVLSFYEHRGDPNLLMVSYEKLHSDRKNEILRIAKFLGEEHYEYLMNHADVLEKVMEHTSFDYMKKNLTFSRRSDEKEVNFFRKGIVGDGKNTLSKEQREKIKDAAQAIKETTIYKEWYP